MKTPLHRFFIVFLFLVLSASFAFAAVNDRPVLTKMLSSARAVITEITVDHANTLMAADKNIVVVDVRTLEEFKAGHLAGAVHLDRGKLEFLAERKLKDKNLVIVLYCKSGGRGSLASETLEQMGYNNVKHVKGGFLAWQKAGYPVVM